MKRDGSFCVIASIGSVATKSFVSLATISFSTVIFFFRKLWYAKVFSNNFDVFPKELSNIIITHLTSQSFHCGIIDSITIKTCLNKVIAMNTGNLKPYLFFFHCSNILSYSKSSRLRLSF